MTIVAKIILFVSCTIFAAYTQAEALPGDAKDVCPIKVGEPLPQLKLKDVKGKDFSLNKAISKKATILVFYRGGWCPYCNVHLGELQTIEGQLHGLGYQIIAVSPDSPKNLAASVDQNKLSYQLVSDANADAIKALGLAFRLDDASYEKYLGYGINLEKASGKKHHILPVPAAIVLDTAGVAKFVFASPDYKVRVDAKVLLAAAESAMSKTKEGKN